MPGLEYTLGLKTDAFDRGIKNANAESASFSKNLVNISQNGERTTRTLTSGFREIREGAHGAREGMGALTGSMELMGLNVAPRATIAVRTLYEAIKALQAATTVTGLSLGSLGLAGVALAEALAIVASGYQEIKAEMEEVKSVDALENQYDFLKEKLIPELEKYMKLCRLDPKIGQGAINFLNGASDENKPNAIKNAQNAVGPLIKQDKQALIGQQLDAVLRGQQLITETPEQRAKDEFLAGQDEKYQQAVQLAKKSGRPEKEVRDAFNKANQAGLAEINERYNKDPDDEEKRRRREYKPLEHSSLEKMGFLYRGGAGSGSPEKHAADTAKNTRELVGIMKVMLGVNKNGSGGNFGLVGESV